MKYQVWYIVGIAYFITITLLQKRRFFAFYCGRAALWREYPLWEGGGGVPGADDT